MARCVICFTIVILLTLAECQSVRVRRKTGDQPAPGKCGLFMFGGISRYHVYECCNNCNEEHPYCDGKTYQSASKGIYCDKCGVDNSNGSGLFAFQFPCGGCARQNLVNETCLKKVQKYHLDRPGFCWLYAFCFSAYCVLSEKDNLLYSNYTIPDTCFDLVCDLGENTENCPVDCCRSVNKQCNVDIMDKKIVPPLCCTQSSCCK
jgi:hypothetical protein